MRFVSGTARKALVIGGFEVRQATQDDAPGIAAISRESPDEGAAELFDDWADDAGVARMLQTGHDVTVAERDGEVAAFAEWREDEGVAWCERVASAVPGAGRVLVRAFGRRAQDGGLRLVRSHVPEGTLLEDYFAWLGYLPISRETRDGHEWVVVERRVPLLTVREQRRSDAAVIANMTGEDPYAFEMLMKGGCFVAADGDRVVGVTWVSDAGAGAGRVAGPWLDDAYRGRGLEAWMLERLAYHGEHSGYHTVSVADSPALEGLQRDLEDRRWFRDGREYVKRLGGNTLSREMEPPEDWDA